MHNTKEDTARMILDYLRRNPEAGDTIEGISKWWLNREKIDVTVDEISIALEKLITKGTIEKQSVNGENSIYRISKND